LAVVATLAKIRLSLSGKAIKTTKANGNKFAIFAAGSRTDMMYLVPTKPEPHPKSLSTGGEGLKDSLA
jgi:hypothetical protein